MGTIRYIPNFSKNDSDEKFVLTSFDRTAPPERQKIVLASFNFRVSE